MEIIFTSVMGWVFVILFWREEFNTSRETQALVMAAMFFLLSEILSQGEKLDVIIGLMQ